MNKLLQCLNVRLPFVELVIDDTCSMDGGECGGIENSMCSSENKCACMPLYDANTANTACVLKGKD